MNNPPGVYDAIDLQARVDGRYPRIIDDLVTIIDFCDAMAHAFATIGPDPTLAVYAIQDAHDIAHVLTGGDKVRAWSAIKGYLLLDKPQWFGPAWPDVRARMADVLARAEEMTR